VLEDEPSLGRRVVDCRCLRRADNAVHQEGHHRYHEDAGDEERYDHLNERERHFRGVLAGAVLVLAGIIGG
jgi:hypothetical protein